jgi:thiol:disulfide interchange protein DsbC
MNTSTLSALRAALLAPWLLVATLAHAQQSQSVQAAIQKRLQERIPEIGRIDEIRKTSMPGLYEVRVDGTELFYADAKGDFLIRGELFDTKRRANLTQQRANALNAVDWKELPLKDAFIIRKGKGQQQMAVFEDPNCGFCKRLEKELQALDNVTIHIFLYPVLGPDSLRKSQAIWCAKDRAAAWESWMQQGKEPEAASCDTTALDRNLEFGRKQKITGTPTLIFASGTRIPGYVTHKQIEEALKP